MDLEKSSYSSSAYRYFKNFIGELTATAAGVQVATIMAVNHINEKYNIDVNCCMDVRKNKKYDPEMDYWRIEAAECGIVVNGLDSVQIIKNVARLNIVNIYSGFDCFFRALRSDFFKSHEKEWVQYDDDAPFESIYRNAKIDKSELIKDIGSENQAGMEYYRLVRNAIAHPSVEAEKKADLYFKDKIEEFIKIRNFYGMRTAPNKLDELSFHDVKLFARLALDVLGKVDIAFDPGDERMARLIPLEITKRNASAARKENAVKGWAKTHFGISDSRAEEVSMLYFSVIDK